MVRYFDSNLQVVMETDVSNYPIEVLVSQCFEKRLHPVAFYSRIIIPAEQNYNIYNKKILVIVHSMVK